jgi:hypothetical protein
VSPDLVSGYNILMVMGEVVRQDIEQSDRFAQPQLSAIPMADNHFAVHLIYNTCYEILNK